QQRRHINVCVDVVGPAMKQNDHRPIGWASLGIADVKEAGIDLLQRFKGSLRDRRDPSRVWRDGTWLGDCGTGYSELGNGSGGHGGSQETATVRVDGVGHKGDPLQSREDVAAT